MLRFVEVDPNKRAVSARLGTLAAAVLALTLFVACRGSSDNSSSATPALSVGASIGASSSTSAGATASPVSSADKLAECAPADATIGLVSQVAVNGNDGFFTPGQPVDITLILANCGDNNAKLYYATTQRYNFHILDSNGNEVWSSSDGKSYAQTEATEVLAPQTDERFTETWDQKDRNGTQVADGLYNVEAFSVGCSDAARSGCEFGPARLVQIAALTPSPSPTPRA